MPCGIDEHQVIMRRLAAAGAGTRARRIAHDRNADLDAAPLRLFGLFESGAELSPGKRVTLSLQALGVDNDGTPCLRPVFVPVPADLSGKAAA